jgi:hypothetical protein
MRSGFFVRPVLFFAAARRFFAIAAATFFIFLVPISASAQLQQIPNQAPSVAPSAQQNVQTAAQAAGLGGSTTDLPTIIGRIINIFLGFLGVGFLVLLLYAGYQWMTAAGDVEKVKRAQQTIRNAVIGIFIIGAAWAITSFIFGLFAGTTGGGGLSGSGPGGPGGNLPGSSGSLGSGIIEYHLPERNATDVPRNTPIIITFKEPMSPDSFIEPGTGQTSSTQGVRLENIKIFRTSTGNSSALQSNQARVSYTADRRTFVIKPLDYLGSSTQNVNYSVELKGGSNGIQKADGTAAFTGSFGSGYSWQFEVSTKVDLTPPQVVAAIPVSGGQYARNIIIQINFNEAIDPTASTGKTTEGFSNIQVLSGAPGDPNTQPVAGEFRISNAYKTVEFIPTQKCGTNSCGRDVFCLPADHTVETTAKAADIDPQAIPQAIFTNNGYNGVVDVAGNSLDGDKDGAGQGPPNDNFSWSFGTTDSVKLTPPQIESTLPSSDPQAGNNSNIPVDQTVIASFDSLLQSSSLTSESAFIDAHGKDETNPDNFWWFTGMKLLTQSGADYDPAAVPIQIPAKAAITISHRLYLPSGTGIQNLNYYDPYLLSGIQDVYQNCFNPAATCGSGIGSPNCCNNTPNSNPNGCKPLLNP